MKIVYMGTPEFACPALLALNKSRHQIQAVVTGQNKRRGRRGAPTPTEACCLAEELGLPVLTPKSLKSEELYQALKEYNPDLIVVIAFRILPERLFNLPRLGSINIHGSLLPRYRGPAPINWALINGDSETGLTSFFLKESVDAGNIILQEKVSIDDDENFDSLYARLSEMSGPFLLKTIDVIERSGFTPLPQEESQATPAPKISSLDAMIDFGFPAKKVNDFVRGLSTRPGAYSYFRGKKVKVLRCRVADHDRETKARPGSIIADRKRLLVQCAESAIEVLDVVPAGKKPMNGVSFLNGFKPKPGELFGDIHQEVKE